MLNTYDEFKAQVETLLDQLYGLTLNDIDIGSLLTAYQEGITPNEYVKELEDKFGLIKIDMGLLGINKRR